MEHNDNNRILVIAAHPDDEILGCGGTVAIHAANRDMVTSVIVCEGESLRYADEPVNQAEHARKAAQILGVSDLRLLGFPDQRLDTFTLIEIIQPLERIITELQPQLIYCQYGGDLNYDHRIVFDATLVAARPTVSSIRAVLAFDTVSSTEWAYPRSFAPDTWVDITSTLQQKLDALACYDSELRDWPHPRSLKGLRAKAEATGSQCLMAAAEPFMTIRRTCRERKTPV